MNIMEEQTKIKECALAELKECSFKEISSYKDKIIYLESAVRLSEREVEAVKMYVTLQALLRRTDSYCTYSHFVSALDFFFSLSLSLFLSLSLSSSLSLPLSLSLSPYLSISLCLSLTLFLSISLPLHFSSSPFLSFFLNTIDFYFDYLFLLNF